MKIRSLTSVPGMMIVQARARGAVHVLFAIGFGFANAFQFVSMPIGTVAVKGTYCISWFKTDLSHCTFQNTSCSQWSKPVHTETLRTQGYFLFD